MQSSMRKGDVHGMGGNFAIADGSKAVYRHMFNKFLRWLTMHHIPLNLVGRVEIELFLNDPGKKPMLSLIRIRYIRMLERVFDHLEFAPNPASKIAKELDPTETGRDMPKEFLTTEQQSQFLAAMPVIRPYDTDEKNSSDWKRRRDCALLGLLIGAGLKVSEALKQKTDGVREVHGQLEVDVEKYGLSKEHTTVVREFAKGFVLDWHAERVARKIPGDYLFPPSLTGLNGKGEPTLTKMTVYRLARKVFAAAGIEVQREGGRTLRNTFAVQELQDGVGLDRLKDKLGLHEMKSAEKYVPKPKQSPFTDTVTVEEND